MWFVVWEGVFWLGMAVLGGGDLHEGYGSIGGGFGGGRFLRVFGCIWIWCGVFGI